MKPLIRILAAVKAGIGFHNRPIPIKNTEFKKLYLHHVFESNILDRLNDFFGLLFKQVIYFVIKIAIQIAAS